MSLGLVMSSFGLDGVMLAIYGLLLVGGVLWSLVCGVLLGMKWKVPPVIATAPLFAHAFATAGAGSYGVSQAANAFVAAAPEQRATLLAYSISQVMMAGVYAPIALFSAGIVATGALVGGLRGPKWWGLPVLSILIFAFVSLLPMVTVFYDASFPSALGRVALYGLFTIPAGLAMAGAHPNQSGREAGVIAGVAFLSLVATVEMSVISSAWARGFAAIAGAEPSSKVVILAAMQSEMAPVRNVAWAAILISAVPAALALFRAPMPLSDEEIMNSSVSPSGMRWFGSMLALLLLPVWAIAFVSVDPAGTFATLLTTYNSDVPAAQEPGQ